MGSTGGWNKPSANQPAKKGGAKSPSPVRGIVAGLVVVALAAGALFMFSNKDAVPKERPAKERGIIRDVAHVIVKPAVEPRRAKIAHPKSVDEAIANVGEMKQSEMIIRRMTPEEWYNLTNRVFSTSTEQIMSWVFTLEPGNMPMPLPEIDAEEKKNLAAILISRNKISENDSESVAFCKESVDFAKKEMAKYIREGGDPEEFLRYYHNELMNAFEYRCEVESQVSKLCRRQKDRELAREFCERANELLKEKGIRQVDFQEHLPVGEQDMQQNLKEEDQK